MGGVNFRDFRLLLATGKTIWTTADRHVPCNNPSGLCERLLGKTWDHLKTLLDGKRHSSARKIKITPIKKLIFFLFKVPLPSSKLFLYNVFAWLNECMHSFTVFNNDHNSESFYFSSIKDDISKTVDLLIMGD